MHKSKAGHGEGAMVRVDRKCEVYVWVRGRWCGVEEAGERGGEGDGSWRLLRPLVGVGRELVSTLTAFMYENGRCSLTRAGTCVEDWHLSFLISF